MNVASAQKVVVVSGGSRGLGAAIVESLLADGHAVATFSRGRSPQVDAWSSHAAYEARFLYRAVDAADAKALREFVQQAFDRFGQVDALVNNAAVVTESLLPTADEASTEAMLDVNLKGAIVLCKECTRLMLLRERGVVINIASVAAERGLAGLAVYSATKAGLLGLTRSLARELGPRGIRVNAIAPGYLETEMSADLSPGERERIARRTPLGRLGQVEDIVPWVKFLLSDAGGFMTGQVLIVDGGASV
jgi:3-oxoacyl-[acyl-carrier protein] reductase